MYEHRIVTVSSRRLDKQLGEAERAALFEIAQGLRYGTGRMWNGECEVFTAAGLLEIAAQMDERGLATGAAVVRAEIDGLRANAARPVPDAAAGGSSQRRHRAHIPYADADDELIFAGHQGEAP